MRHPRFYYSSSLSIHEAGGRLRLKRRVTVMDTDKGKALLERTEDLMELVGAYRDNIIKESF